MSTVTNILRLWDPDSWRPSYFDTSGPQCLATLTPGDLESFQTWYLETWVPETLIPWHPETWRQILLKFNQYFSSFTIFLIILLYVKIKYSKYYLNDYRMAAYCLGCLFCVSPDSLRLPPDAVVLNIVIVIIYIIIILDIILNSSFLKPIFQTMILIYFFCGLLLLAFKALSILKWCPFLPFSMRCMKYKW